MVMVDEWTDLPSCGWNEKAEAGDLILSLELEQPPPLFLLRLQVVWPLEPLLQYCSQLSGLILGPLVLD